MTGRQAIQRPTRLSRNDEIRVGRFEAMASPCEILMAVSDDAQAEALLQIAATEAWRIEQKYSRYREDGIIPRINNSAGKPVQVDAETAHLLDFAYQCYDLSDGLFDITSGILRKAWPFQPGSRLPTQQTIDSLLPLVGLHKAQWQDPWFTLPAGMQIDFGGLGKEYAVDTTLALLLKQTKAAVLVNFGGDVACNRCPSVGHPWRIGIEATDAPETAARLLELRTGALATSGSTHRFLIEGERRYGHVLNPLTGWPVPDPPLSVTVAAPTCTNAGMLATFAMLQGRDAEEFLEQQDVRYWIQRQ